MAEIHVIVLRCADHARIEVVLPEFSDVVDDDEVGIEVNDACDGRSEKVGEVDVGVIQWVVKGVMNGGEDQVNDCGGLKE